MSKLIKTKNYISKADGERIRKYCIKTLVNKEPIRVKLLALMLEEKYCLHDVMLYIKNELGLHWEYLWRGSRTHYTNTLERGHIVFSHCDLYFGNKYYHQYVVCKELNLDIKQVEKYVIHHINQDKADNRIENLFVFYDKASHLSFHQALKKDKDIDINQFNADYIESIIDESNAEDIKEYLKVVEHRENIVKGEVEDEVIEHRCA